MSVFTALGFYDTAKYINETGNGYIFTFAAMSGIEDKMNKRANPDMRLIETLLPSIAKILRTSVGSQARRSLCSFLGASCIRQNKRTTNLAFTRG